jgi:hypothetical protein
MPIGLGESDGVLGEILALGERAYVSQGTE